MNSDLIKVSAHSGVGAVAGAIAGAIRENDRCDVQVVGAGALNQAVKAVIIARGYLAPEGKDIAVLPSFTEAAINGEDRTAIRLTVVTR